MVAGFFSCFRQMQLKTQQNQNFAADKTVNGLTGGGKGGGGGGVGVRLGVGVWGYFFIFHRL